MPISFGGMKKEVESVVIRVSEEQVMCLEVAAREVGAIERGFGGVYKGVCVERNRAESPITGSRNVYLTLRTEMADAHKVLVGLAHSLRTAGYADVRASVEYSWGARQRNITNISYILARDSVTREAGKEISPAQFFSDTLGVHRAVAVTLFKSERQDEKKSNHFLQTLSGIIGL